LDASDRGEWAVVRGLLGRAAEGHFDARTDLNALHGTCREIAEQVHHVLDVVEAPIRGLRMFAEAVARGEVPPPLEDKLEGELDALRQNLNVLAAGVGAVRNVNKLNDVNELNDVRLAVKALVDDAHMLSMAAGEGRLDVRADPGRHQGDFRKIVQGLNDMLEAVAAPLRIAGAYVDRISNGDIPETLTASYQGDFDQIRQSLNRCIGAVHALVDDTGNLSRAAVEGRLSARTDPSRHHGAFRSIVQGINHTLDAVIGPLTVAATCVDRMAKGEIPPRITETHGGDFKDLENNLNACIDAIQALIEDSNMLSKAAVEGNLSTRADTSRHHGDFRRVVEGFNDTLDAVIEPLTVTGSYVERIAKGDIPARITERYSGDFEAFKNNLNAAMESIHALIDDTSMLEHAAVEGKLTVRVDASRHRGDFKKIVQGVNATLDAVTGPLSTTGNCVERISKGDIPPKIADTYRGDFEALKNDLNALIASLQEIASLAQRIADGDLTVRVTPRSENDLLLRAIGQMVNNLNELLLRTRDVTKQVTQAAEEVATASQSLSAGAVEQVSALAQISVSMNELAAQTQQNAENAAQANGLTGAARDGAMRGNEQMKEMVSAMREIEDSSHRISKIIKVIDEIAFQTNLLALNAAVEAARAGHHGKGFAVVADEVRNLAARSAKAAEETTEMIEGAIEKVARGTEIAHKTSEALSIIVAQSSKVSDLAAEIAAASREQAQGIQQATQGLGQIEVVTQRSRGSAEQGAAASTELLAQSSMLRETVGRFKLLERPVAALPASFTPEMLALLQQFLLRGGK
ncbi:MAG: methyl-accepting chemotaxis protein, partial [Myxococcales bacterium]